MMKRASLLAKLTSAFAASLLASAPARAADSQPADAARARPNIVVIMVDNLGWGELGVYGGGLLRGAATPRLDQLAAEGTRLLNFNVEPQCTPSRSAFMTGRHPIRSGTTRVVWGMLYGLTQWEVTLAELLSGAGYATGIFGKWHLGDTAGRFPTDQGFDEWYGIPNTSDESMYSSQFQFDRTVARMPRILESTRGQKPRVVADYDIPARRRIDAELVQRATAFMKRSVGEKRPFFAFVPLTQPHLPTLPHPDFDGKTGNGHYADVLAEIDHRSGQILDEIEALGIRETTVVIFLSDNGPERSYPWQGTAGPWRGQYFTALEGSLRVPFLVRWPGKVPAGRVSNEMMHLVDMLPTLARVAGYKAPADRLIDGVDQLDFVLGKHEKSRREGFPVYNGDEMFAYKWRNWKVHLIELNQMDGTPQRLNVPKCYNLITDPKEEYNMGAEATWVAPIVMGKIVAFQKTLVIEPPIRLGTPDP